MNDGSGSPQRVVRRAERAKRKKKKKKSKRVHNHPLHTSNTLSSLEPSIGLSPSLYTIEASLICRVPLGLAGPVPSKI